MVEICGERVHDNEFRDGFRMQRRCCADLRAEIGRGVDERPTAIASGDRKAGLRARFHAHITRPGEGTDRAATIPLRKRTSRRRAEHYGGEAPHLLGQQGRGN